MPKFPENQFLHINKKQANGSIPNTAMRMAIAPEDTIAWKKQQPKQSKNVSEYLFETGSGNKADIYEDERCYKRLFFRSLDRLAMQQSYDVNSKEIFSSKDRIVGSQSLLLRMDFSEKLRLNEKDYNAGERETTTPYKFVFDFAWKYKTSKNELDHAVSQPIFLVDDALLKDMEKKGISSEQTQGYFAGFMKMAGLAEHDYIHGLYDTYNRDLPYSSERDNFYGDTVETFALALHAKGLGQSFKERPKRKHHVLAYAQESFSQIADMQQQLQAGAKDAKDVQTGSDIVNYLTSIYAHRFFRVISPDDPDLDVKMGKDALSVNETLEKIHIDVPVNRIDDMSDYSDTMSNKEKLLLNLSSIAENQRMLRPGIYRDIHKINAVRVSHDVYSEYGLLEMLDHVQTLKNGTHDLEEMLALDHELKNKKRDDLINQLQEAMLHQKR